MLTSTNHRSPRTYRIVGPQRQIDERETPHPRVERGELGERIRLYRKTRHEQDVLRRTLASSGVMKGDKNNNLRHVMMQVPEGKVSPDRIPVSDPAAMARKIKEVARFFGVNAVGITHLEKAYVFSHRARGCSADGEKPGDPIQLPHQYAIVLGFDGDYDLYMAHNSPTSDRKFQLPLSPIRLFWDSHSPYDYRHQEISLL